VREFLIKLRQHLLSGVSFAIPFIACGGIMIATAIALVPIKPPVPAVAAVPAHDGVPAVAAVPAHGGGPDFDGHPVLKEIHDIGVASFTLMPAVLAGYISFSIAGKPGLVAGFVGGWLATHIPNGVDAKGVDQFVSAGFLGALIAGLIGGYTVYWLKKPKVPKFVRPIMPILIVPIVSASFVGFVMLNVIGVPIADLFNHLGNWLNSMGSGNQVLLGVILGCMIAFDMGGPINKTAFFFGSAMIAQGNYAVMGAVATAICIPPIGLGLATMIGKKLWTESEREAGYAAFAMGFVGITEGAIPFAAADPLRVIPSIMIGSAVGSVIAMLGGVGDHAPHGGPIVLPVVDHRIMYVIAITVGVVVTAVTVNAVKTFTHGSDIDAAEGNAA
jgi:PTS system fructose-specific IIC component